MNREIKFKVWDSKLNIWINNIGMMKNNVLTHGNERLQVLQFTGLNNKNGEEIYEGDVLRRDSSDGKGLVLGEVYFEEGEFRIKWHPKEKGWNNSLYIHAEDCELIGNKFQNPDLLK